MPHAILHFNCFAAARQKKITTTRRRLLPPCTQQPQPHLLNTLTACLTDPSVPLGQLLEQGDVAHRQTRQTNVGSARACVVLVLVGRGRCRPRTAHSAMPPFKPPALVLEDDRGAAATSASDAVGQGQQDARVSRRGHESSCARWVCSGRLRLRLRLRRHTRHMHRSACLPAAAAGLVGGEARRGSGDAGQVAARRLRVLPRARAHQGGRPGRAALLQGTVCGWWCWWWRCWCVLGQHQEWQQGVHAPAASLSRDSLTHTPPPGEREGHCAGQAAGRWRVCHGVCVGMLSLRKTLTGCQCL